MNRLVQEQIAHIYLTKVKPYLVEKDECLLYTRGKSNGGYGQVMSPTGFLARRITIGVHRVSYSFHSGDIPDNLFVLHKCDVRNCCNPEHLFLGTHEDNMQDMSSKNRTHRPSSSESPMTKLTEKQVLAIYASKDNQRITAKLYNVIQQTVSKIRCKKSWAELTDLYDYLVVSK